MPSLHESPFLGRWCRVEIYLDRFIYYRIIFLKRMYRGLRFVLAIYARDVFATFVDIDLNNIADVNEHRCLDF